MTALFCQGSQSCLESRFMEQQEQVTLGLYYASSMPPNPHTQCSSSISLELSPPKQHNPKELEMTNAMSPPEPGGWSSLYTNIHNPYAKTGIFKDDFFAPALTTNSSIPCYSFCSSVLSEKSLELCTENLGNETGAEIPENCIFSTLDCEVTNLPSEEQTRMTSTQHFGANNKQVSRSFPPPLTTISGRESIKVRPYREDGRLVMKGIKTTSFFGQFQADRSNGRLRLCILRERDQTDNEERKEEEEEKEEDEKAEEEEEEDDGISNSDNENGGEELKVENEVGCKNDNVGGKTGIEIFKRPERCIGSETRNLLKLDRFLVATS